MLSDATFEQLRMAATVAVALPTVHVRISSATELLVEVAWEPGDEAGDVVHMRPCGFRGAVACARQRRDLGHPISFCRLEPGVDPVVEVAVGPGERRLPGGIYQVCAQGGWRLVFPVVLTAEECERSLGPAGSELSFHEDPLLGVTLVHARTSDGPTPPPAALVDSLVDTRARLLTEELARQVAAAARPA